MVDVSNRGLLRLFHRASWSVLDQGLSAASNLLLSVIVARTLDAAGFGAFAVAFLIFGLMIAVARAIIGQPLQITFSAAPEAEWHAATRSAIAASILLGAVVGTVLAVTGLALGTVTGDALLAVGVCMPGLLAQDTCRMAFFSSGRAKQAALNDGLWTLLEFAALGLMIVLGVHTVWAFILAWGGSATVAALVAMLVLHAPPRFRGSVRWVLAQRGLTGYLLAEHVLGEGLTQVGLLMVGVVGKASDVGSLRAGQVLLGPLNVLVTAASVFGIPEIARRRDMTVRERQRFCWTLTAGVCVATVVYCALVLLLPGSVGRQLFGATWAGAQGVLPAFCALYLAVAIGSGPGITLYGMGAARVTFGLNLIKGPILLVTLSLGIWYAGAVGAAWAMAVTEAVLLPFLIVKALRVMRGAGGAPPAGGELVLDAVGLDEPVNDAISVRSPVVLDPGPAGPGGAGPGPRRGR